MRARNLLTLCLPRNWPKKELAGCGFRLKKAGYGNQIFEIRNNEKRCLGKADTL
jgi:hypothetical protein